MHWIDLNELQQLEEIRQNSFSQTQIIFKNSTTCSISKMVYARLNNAKETLHADYYYLDLLTHRDISNAVSEMFDVQHESPQILIIKDDKCIYHENHSAIYMNEIAAHV